MAVILQWVNATVWSVPTLMSIAFVGIWIAVRTGVVQLRFFPKALHMLARSFRDRKKTTAGASAYRSLCTALAATVGTGNIAGVAGAIALGGPGAVFWMWVFAVLGMGIKYAEAALAVRFRSVDQQGTPVGGPMYMIQNGLKPCFYPLSVVYCVFALIAAFGVGNATQVNTVVQSASEALRSIGAHITPVSNVMLTLIMAGLVYGILSGGGQRIGKIAEKIVPYAAVMYILMCLAVLLLRCQQIPDALERIFQGAMNPDSVTGGAVGSLLICIRTGASRGIFTNEAGMGTASIAHAGADVDHPVKQGLMGIVEVFVDTILICTLTALVILSSGIEIPYGTDLGASLTAKAFSHVLGNWSCLILAFILCCFAVATVLGWGLYGMRCSEFLFGAGSLRPFILFQLLTVIAGGLVNTGTVWLFSETVNALMAFPNLITLFMLTPELVRLTKDFKCSRKIAAGGTYEDFNQRQSLRTFSYEKVSPPGRKGGKTGKNHLSSEYRKS